MAQEYRITAHNDEQAWIDAFNEHTGSHVELNQVISKEEYFNYRQPVIQFNHEVACGPAICLKKVTA